MDTRADIAGGLHLFSHITDYTTRILENHTAQVPNYLIAQVRGTRDEIRTSVDLIHQHQPHLSIMVIGHDVMPNRLYFIAYCSESCRDIGFGLNANDWIKHVGIRGGGTESYAEGYCPYIDLFSEEYNHLITLIMSYANSNSPKI